MAGALFGLGSASCILDSSAYVTGSGGAGAGGSGGTTSTSTSDGGSVGGTTTVGGGGSGGTTTVGGGGSGGSTTTVGGGGTGGSVLGTPLSCQDALDNHGMTKSGLTTIDVDEEEGPELPFEVWCDQENEGGGWALVFNSVGDPAGKTTDFWQKIKHMERWDAHGGPPSLTTNYFHGFLYKYGKEYRDDVAGPSKADPAKEAVILNMLRAKANGVNDDLKLLDTNEIAGVSLSNDVFVHNFIGGWASSDQMGDAAAVACAVAFLNVAQHYGSCLRYSLGADTVDADPTPDQLDEGWGPHVLNAVLDTVNLGKTMDNQIRLEGSGYSNHSSRVQRISRFARWP